MSNHRSPPPTALVLARSRQAIAASRIALARLARERVLISEVLDDARQTLREAYSMLPPGKGKAAEDQ